MNPTKNSNRKTGRVIDPDAPFLSKHPWFSIIILLILYYAFSITPGLMYNIYVSPIFIASHYYINHIIDFFSVAILWSIIVPLVLGLPNRREFIGYARSIKLARIKPILRSIGLGIITAIITLAFMLFATFLSSLIQGQVVFDPGLLTHPLTINVYTSLRPGIWEEVAFRGVMLVLLLKIHSKHFSIVINGFLFGAFHSVNILTAYFSYKLFNTSFNQETIIPILFQVVYTSMLGIFIAYMFVKTKMLLPCIIAHYLIDAFSTLVIYNNNPPFWAYFCFLTFIGIGFIPMIINISLVRSFSFWFPEPDDEIIPFFDTFLVRKQRLKQYKSDIRSA